MKMKKIIGNNAWFLYVHQKGLSVDEVYRRDPIKPLSMSQDTRLSLLRMLLLFYEITPIYVLFALQASTWNNYFFPLFFILKVFTTEKIWDILI